MVILEAMASGRPVISTRVGAIPHLIDHEFNGLLVEPGNVSQLSASMGRLLENKEEANRYAQKGLEKVSKEFSSRTMGLKYHEIYRKIMEGKGTEHYGKS